MIAVYALLGLLAVQLSQACTPYTVRSGDTCYNIWTYYGMDQTSFYNANPGVNCNNLQVGQVLCVGGYVAPTVAPSGYYGTYFPYNSCNVGHPVRAGETCSSIAAAYGMTLNQFLTYNPNINCGALQVNSIACVQNYVAPTTVSPYSCSRSYVVQPGDTCDSISRYNGVDLNSFYAANPYINCYPLTVGTVLCLNAYGTVAPTTAYSSCATPYTVQPGDTCWSIMSRYGVANQASFYGANPYINCNNLQVGQSVCLSYAGNTYGGNTYGGNTYSGCKYTIQPGDTYTTIANARGTTVTALTNLNPGVNPNTLQVGQVINIC